MLGLYEGLCFFFFLQAPYPYMVRDVIKALARQLALPV